MSGPATVGSLAWGRMEFYDGSFGPWLWVIQCRPNVAIRIKRMFPRAQQARRPGIFISDTPEVARDIEWLLDRHPLSMSPEVAKRLKTRADEHRAMETKVDHILDGNTLVDASWLVPVRPPRDYQQVAADLAWTTQGTLIGDDVGLGKTQTGLTMLRDPDTLPALVVTLTHLPKQWQREVAAIYPGLKVHIAKTTTPPADVEADIVIMGYSKLAGWADALAGQVKTVIFDEVQELRNAGTKKHDAAKVIADKADWRMGLSATPVYNYGDEIHPIYDVLAPDRLGTREEFLREWGGGLGTGGHTTIENPAALGQYLRDEGLLLRRTRKDVGRELPETLRIVQNVDSNPAAMAEVEQDVAAMAALILDKSADRQARFQASGDIDMKMRQATGIAKAPYVAEFVRLLLESEQAVVLFGWHRAVYDIWAAKLADFNPVLYTGTESTTRKNANVEAFLNGQSRVLMMSLRSGAGLDGLQMRSSTAVFGEMDWSPEVMNQCIGRLARDGQDSPVASYFMLAEVGSDPVMAEVNEIKRQQSEPIRNPDAPLSELVDSSALMADRIKMLARSVVDRGAGKTWTPPETIPAPTRAPQHEQGVLIP